MPSAPRSRPSRQAAARVSYAEAADAGDSDDDEPRPPPAKRARATKSTKKGKKPASDAEDKQAAVVVPPDAYLWADVTRDVMFDWTVDKQDGASNTSVTRVDWTTLLPVEVLLEICSHLRPVSLWNLAFVNKRMHAALTSDSGALIWRQKLESSEEKPQSKRGHRRFWTWSGWRSDSESSDSDEDNNKARMKRKQAREERRLPFENGKPVSPLKVTALLFARTCQICGTQTKHSDYVMLACVCSACVDREGVPLKMVAGSEEYDDLHPLASELVRTTLQQPSNLKPHQRRPPYVLRGDLQAVSERLEELQMEDNASGARAGGRRTRRGRASVATVAEPEAGGPTEEEPYSHLTPRVRQFVQARFARKAEREKISAWVCQYGARIRESREESKAKLSFEHGVREERLQRIIDRILQDGLFANFVEDGLRIKGFARHPLVSLVEPLTEEVWLDIRPRLYKDLGRCVAYNILEHHGARYSYSTKIDWEAIMPELLEQPLQLSDQVWEYVQPQIVELIKEEKEAARQRKLDEVKAKAIHERALKVDTKKTFFRDRLDKIRDCYTNLAVRAYLPNLPDFCLLPVVCDFWDDPAFAISPSRERADLKKWEGRLDEILAVVDEYKIDVRLAALKGILAATTDRSETEIDALDVDVLADPAYGDDFFLRPSSWVHCTSCSYFGPLANVLRHRQDHAFGWKLEVPVGLEDEPEATVAGSSSAGPSSKENRNPERRKKTPVVQDSDEEYGGPAAQQSIGAADASVENHAKLAHASRAVVGTSEQYAKSTAPEWNTKPAVELSLEVACAMLSLCEIGGFNADDPTITPQDFDERFETTRFLWKNADTGRAVRHKWLELIQDVCWKARDAHVEGTVLQVPDIRSASLTFRERWRLEERQREEARRKNRVEEAQRKQRLEEARLEQSESSESSEESEASKESDESEESEESEE
ncbi:hypothetical protein JCM3774_001522 [Rhodotorula dairenensis]